MSPNNTRFLGWGTVLSIKPVFETWIMGNMDIFQFPYSLDISGTTSETTFSISDKVPTGELGSQ